MATKASDPVSGAPGSPEAGDPSLSSAEEEEIWEGDGIYVLRTTQQNQIQLNLMADQKANIIIGVSLIFFTIAQTQLIGFDPEGNGYLAPLLILAVAMLCSFLLSVLVVAPKMKRSSLTRTEKLPNPLFFGFFASVEQDEFVEHLQENLKRNRDSREIFLRDIYQTGCVLRRKYRLLRFAYLFLAAGILASALSMAGLNLFYQ